MSIEELWIEVKRDPSYEVSNLGNVRRKSKRYKNLKSSKHSGYYAVTLSNQRPVSVHTLVSEAFIGPRDKGLEVDHIDHNKTNNKSINLRYITHLENIQRSFNNRGRGRFYEGEIWLIRKLLARSIPTRQIAKMFRCNKSTIFRINHNLSYLCKPTPLA